MAQPRVEVKGAAPADCPRLLGSAAPCGAATALLPTKPASPALRPVDTPASAAAPRAAATLPAPCEGPPVAVNPLLWGLFGLHSFTAAYVHFRGKARFAFGHQLTDHSSLLAPLNTLLYLSSKVPGQAFLDPA